MEGPGLRPIEAAKRWAQGRNPWVRLPLLLWLGWIFVRHLQDPEYGSLFAGLNLGIHELGHFLFSPFGEFLGMAGGTILQCLVPVIGILMFVRQKDAFAVTFALCWLGTNFYHIAPYAADARARELPLVSPVSGAPLHDWHYMLGRLGWLQHDALIGDAFRLAGTLCMGAGLLAGAWLLWQMHASRAVAPT